MNDPEVLLGWLMAIGWVWLLLYLPVRSWREHGASGWLKYVTHRPGEAALGLVLWAGCLIFFGWLLLGNLAHATVRSPAQVRTFRAENPCPTTGRVRGACPGWQVDHIVPLCAGGEDAPRNMHWLPVEDHRWKTFVDVRECRKLRSQVRVDEPGPLLPD